MPSSQVAVGAPVKGGELDGRSAGANHFESVGNDFFADAVSGNHCDAFVGRHGKIVSILAGKLSAVGYQIAFSVKLGDPLDANCA